jgi:glycosyltransferase involved in cell wall biosynthesis
MNNPSDRIRVLFVMVQIDIMGGSEQLVYKIIEQLDRSRFDPCLAWFYGDRLLGHFKKLDLPLYHVPKIKRFDPAAMRQLASIITKKGIHVVNAHHFLSMVYSFYGAKIGNRAQLIYTEHSVWEVERISSPWKRIGRCLLKRADAAVGVTDAVTRQLRQTFGTDPARTVTILNGVDTACVGANRETLRRSFAFGEQDQVIGIVANLKKVKNHLLLLRAFVEVLREQAHTRLLLVGQGLKQDRENTEPEIRAFITQNGLGGKVILAGYRSDIPDLLGVMDVFCLCSREEGLPISLIEAMAAGLPVVGTDVEGIRGVIDHERNGLLVGDQDVPALTAALLTLLRNGRLGQALGSAARVTVQDRFSLSRCVSEYQHLFQSACEKAPGRAEQAGPIGPGAGNQGP